MSKSKLLIIAENPFDSETWERIETDDVCATLASKYERIPEFAKLYCGNVAAQNDVTPQCKEDIDALASMEGPFYLVCYPGWEAVLYIAVALIAVVAAIALKPKIPNTTNRNIQSESPNNQLSGRTNSIRINGRIPDIFGKVRSTPDLIAVPYTVFENNKEVEYTYMCIGRGYFAIDDDDCRDGQTRVSEIDGETVEIFEPFTSPNNGASPQLRIGDPITRKVIAASRSKSVNGQTLEAPNENTANGTSTLTIIGPNKVKVNGGGVDLTTKFVVGDIVNLTMPPFYGDGEIYNTNNGAYGYPVEIGTQGILPGEYLTVRFYPDGRIEFQDINSWGISPAGVGSGYYLNDGGKGFLRLVADVGGIDLSGPYVVSYGADPTKLQVDNPTRSNPNWASVSGPSAWVSARFIWPEVPGTFEAIKVNLSGDYELAGVTADTLEFKSPDLFDVNGEWEWFQYQRFGSANQKPNVVGFLSAGGLAAGWIGPFTIDIPTTTELICNFVALQGMYKDDGTSQSAATVTIQVGVTPVDAIGNAIGSESFYSIDIVGSATKRSQVSETLSITGLKPGRVKVRARRLTAKDLLFNGQISDEVKWRDLYASSPVSAPHFGDVTTVHCRTVATEQALAISERQINMLVWRKLASRISGSTFSTVLTPTSDAARIISHICLDPKIGNRKLREVNFDNVFDTVADIVSYFGFASAGDFNYTIDKENLSFEETIQMVADAIFCNAHRRGNVIEIAFEKKTDVSRLLFATRNKVPGSEKRTVTFGNVDDYDGIEYEYVSPDDDAVVTFYIPADQSAVKPLKIQSVGIRSHKQAHLHAWRERNRLDYQNVASEFEATQEADLLALRDRVLIADNTRPDTQDGEILDQDGLILETSQPVVFASGVSYVASLQLPSGFVENIPISAGVDSYHVVLGSAPSEPLSLADDAAVRTIYQIVRIDDVDKQAFLITEKTFNSNFTCNLQAVNYDERYYEKDLDFFGT